MRRARRWAIGIVVVLIIGAALPVAEGLWFWRSELNAGRAAEDAGRAAEARRHYETAVRLARAFPFRGPQLAWSLIGLGNVALGEARDDEARRAFEEAAALLEKRPKGREGERADCYRGLASAAGHQNRNDEAETHLKRAEMFARQAFGPEDPFTITIMSDRAWVRCNQGRYADAERLERDALARFEELGKRGITDRQTIARNQHYLAWFLICLDRFEEAKVLLERSAAVFQTEGADDGGKIELTRCLNALAIVQTETGRFHEAEALLRRAIALQEKLLPADHPDLATSRANLARALTWQGRFDEARSLFEQAARSFATALGPSAAALAHTFSGLARLESKTGQNDAAMDHARHALAIYEKTWGPSHPRVGRALSQIAKLELDRGAIAPARALAERARAVLEKTGPPLALAQCLDVLGRVNAESGDRKTAEELLRRALTLREPILHGDGPDTADGLDHLAEVLRKSGKTEEARSLERRAKAVRERLSTDAD